MSNHILCIYCGATHSDLFGVDEQRLRCTVCGFASTIVSDVPPARPTDDSIPQQIGRYRIRGRLGTGAFGSVYRAYDPRLGRDVALKTPHAEIVKDENMRKRMLREPKAAARLRHPNIVPVYDADVHGGTFYIASGFVPGRTLEEAMADGRFTFKRTAHIVAALADALHHAHRAGITHRDVKPANVMLGADGEPQLMDFGIAHWADENMRLTQSGAVLGTPAYMPPEQARGDIQATGPCSDQYSLGVVLYEMLTGRLPFPTVQLLHLELASPHESPVLQRLADEVQPELAAVCRRAMSKLPQDRFASCEEMAAVIGEYAATSPDSTPVAPLEVRESKPPAPEAAPQPLEVVTNSIAMTFVPIPAGWFMMGSPAGSTGAVSDESPPHMVRITKPFLLAQTAVTQEQWIKVMQHAPQTARWAATLGANHPATHLTWSDAVQFCRKLSAMEGVEYRLPTEAEWEYACRAGTTTKFSFPDDKPVDDYVWFEANSKGTQAVGNKLANGWGLFDMHGNVWEWCSDWFGEKYYVDSPSMDPPGPSTGQYRVVRGGGWESERTFCRSAFRYWHTPGFHHRDLGFRPVRVG